MSFEELCEKMKRTGWTRKDFKNSKHYRGWYYRNRKKVERSGIWHIDHPMTFFYRSIKRVSFRVRKIYFDLIISGEKKQEIRTDKPHWSWLLGIDPPRIATFICGKRIHRRWITNIYRDNPEKVLGRSLSAQGQKDVLTNPAIIIELGEEYTE